MTDSSDNDDLFEPVFKQKTARPASKKRQMASKREAVAPKHEAPNAKAPPSLEEMKQKAKRTAYSDLILPSGISHARDLVWYQHSNSDGDILHIPCRICEASEARHVRLQPNSWDEREVSLVQALLDEQPFSSKYNRILADKSSLIPYHNNGGGSGNGWCPKLLQIYHKQRRAQAQASYSSSYSTREEWTTVFFLQRILEHAQQQDDNEEKLSSDSESNEDKKCATAQKTRRDHPSSPAAHSQNSAASSIASDDLQVPYAEHLLSDQDDDDYLDDTLFDYDETSNEPLRPGDVIQYTSPIFTAGDARGKRITTVLSTNPTRHPILVLQNGDVLPAETSVKRVQVLEFGKLYPHKHGYYRPISSFKMEIMGTANVLDGFRQEGKRVDDIMERNLANFAAKQNKEGFAPMDLFHKRKKKTSTRTTTTVEEQGPPQKKRARTADTRNGSSSSKKQPAKKKPAREVPRRDEKPSRAKNDGNDSDSSSCSEDSDISLPPPKQATTKKSRTLDTKRLLEKMKEKGTAAFDSSDSSSSGDDDQGRGDRVSRRQEQVARKPAASKKSRHSVTQTKSRSAVKKPSSKPAAAKKTSKKEKGGTRTKSAISTKTSIKKKDSRKSSGSGKVRFPPAVSKPGDWMTTRRTARESLGVDSDVTSLASLHSEERRGSSTEKKKQHERSQDSSNHASAHVPKQRNTKRKRRVETSDEEQAGKSNRRGKSISSNKRQKRNDSSESDSSIDAAPFAKKRAPVSKRSALSPSPMADEENAAGLLNSPRRKREKLKRSTNSNRGKIRVELGSSSSKRHGKKPARSQRKKTGNEDSMTFHASSSEEDESSVEIQKFTNRPPKRELAFPKAKRSSASRNKGTIDIDSDSSVEVVAVANDKSPVLDLTKDGSDSMDSSDEENPVPLAKRTQSKKRAMLPLSKTAKTTSTTSFSAVAAQPVSKPFGLAITKHNVRRKRQSGKKINMPFASNRTVDDSDDDLDTKSARKQQAESDCGDWGTTYRRGNSALSSPSSMGLSSSKSNKSSSTHSFQPTATQGTNRLESQSSTGQRVDPTAKNAGDEELVDTSDEDSLLNSNSQKQSLPRKRLFQSEQWKENSSQGSYAAGQRIPVASRYKRQNRRH